MSEADAICTDNPDQMGGGGGVMRAVVGWVGGSSARDSVCMHACFCVYVSVVCMSVLLICKCCVYVSVVCMSVLLICKCCVYVSVVCMSVLRVCKCC